MNKSNGSRGFTLTEVILSTLILSIIMLGFAGLLRYTTVATTKIVGAGEGQESTRIGLNKVEEALLHANEIRIASGTFVEFIDDIDQSPNYNPNGQGDLGCPPAHAQNFNLPPNYLNPDRANTMSIFATNMSSPWIQAGDNLQNDDEDCDGNIDVMKRIYWSNGSVYLDTSINQDAWGQRVQMLIPNVSSFTLTYFGNPTIPPGNAVTAGVPVDSNGNGIIEWNEMDCAPPNTQPNYCDGQLDTRLKLSYITFIQIHLEVINNKNGNKIYAIDTDVNPPLLPLKAVEAG